LNISPSPFWLTKRGPISTTAPYPIEEHPGPNSMAKLQNEM